MSEDDGSDDARLVAEVLGPRPEGFGALVARYERLVAALVARTTRARGETEDLVQDVFLEAFRKLGTLREPSRFKGWLVQIAFTRARLFGRRRRVERASLARAAVSGEAAAERSAPERDEEKARVLAALRELPEETQAIVALRYLEGRSAPEIAATVGATPEAVRMRLSRALAELRGRLAREDRAP